MITEEFASAPSTPHYWAIYDAGLRDGFHNIISTDSEKYCDEDAYAFGYYRGCRARLMGENK